MMKDKIQAIIYVILWAALVGLSSWMIILIFKALLKYTSS